MATSQSSIKHPAPNAAAHEKQAGEELIANDPLLAAYGSGKDLWADEHADEYLTRLRAGWD